MTIIVGVDIMDFIVCNDPMKVVSLISDCCSCITVPCNESFPDGEWCGFSTSKSSPELRWPWSCHCCSRIASDGASAGCMSACKTNAYTSDVLFGYSVPNTSQTQYNVLWRISLRLKNTNVPKIRHTTDTILKCPNNQKKSGRR